jgi:hypothetical protein
MSRTTSFMTSLSMLEAFAIFLRVDRRELARLSRTVLHHLSGANMVALNIRYGLASNLGGPK